jgi:hypothetical protein
VLFWTWFKITNNFYDEYTKQQKICVELPRCSQQSFLPFPQYVQSHHPAMLVIVEQVSKQFRFESAWLLENSYNNMLANCWDYSIPISNNLLKVQQEVKEWKLQTLHQISIKKMSLWLEFVASKGG